MSTTTRFLKILSHDGEKYPCEIGRNKTDYLKDIIEKLMFTDFSNCFDNIENYDIQGKNGNVRHDIDLIINDILTNKIKTIVSVLLCEMNYRAGIGYI